MDDQSQRLGQGVDGLVEPFDCFPIRHFFRRGRRRLGLHVGRRSLVASPRLLVAEVIACCVQGGAEDIGSRVRYLLGTQAALGETQERLLNDVSSGVVTPNDAPHEPCHGLRVGNDESGKPPSIRLIQVLEKGIGHAGPFVD